MKPTTPPAGTFLCLIACMWLLSCASAPDGDKASRAPRIDAEALLRTGLSAIEERRFDDAFRPLSQGFEARPDDARFAYAVGLCYMGMGEAFAANPDLGGDPGSAFYDGETSFRKTLALAPDHPEAEAMLAKALYMNGNLSDARSRIQAHLVRHPDDAAAHLLAGRIYIASSASADTGGTALLETAERHLEKALALDPGSPAAYLTLGDCRIQKGDAPAGLAAYKEGIALNPEYTALHERLASVFTGSEFLGSEDAVGFYKDLLGRGETSPVGKGNLWWFLGAWNETLGRAAYAEERFTEAAEAYAESAACYEKCGIVHEPFAAHAQHEQAQAWTNTGWAYYYGKEYVLAEARFSRALAVEPELQNAVLGIDYLGTAIVNAMGMAKARDFFRRQAQSNPWNSRWWNNYALLCRETGQYEESYTAYVKAMNLSPDDTRYVNDAGMMLLYYLKRQPEKAEELFKMAWKAGEEKLDNPFLSEEDRAYHFEACCDAMLNLARLYLTLDRAAEAEPIARAVAEKAPDRPDVKRLLISVRETKEGKPYVLPE